MTNWIAIILSKWKKIPEQIRRFVGFNIIIVTLFIVVRSSLVPPDFGKYGHYRASVIDEIVSQELHYAGQEECVDCHDDIVEEKVLGYHKNVSCEVCHGPAAVHADEPDSLNLDKPGGRNLCPVCHEYLPSRPTGFPQIVAASHNPIKSCKTCHNPHDPKPPETPKECGACHAEISRTKSLSHHAYIPCIKCHETVEEHKINPREFIPAKPMEREFCGQCHYDETAASEDVPQIDLATHEERYVCWQCHYPHLPEAH